VGFMILWRRDGELEGGGVGISTRGNGIGVVVPLYVTMLKKREDGAYYGARAPAEKTTLTLEWLGGSPFLL
ncbi:MFS transporter, partial [Salmonella enterica]